MQPQDRLTEETNLIRTSYFLRPRTPNIEKGLRLSTVFSNSEKSDRVLPGFPSPSPNKKRHKDTDKDPTSCKQKKGFHKTRVPDDVKRLISK